MLSFIAVVLGSSSESTLYILSAGPGRVILVWTNGVELSASLTYPSNLWHEGPIGAGLAKVGQDSAAISVFDVKCKVKGSKSTSEHSTYGCCQIHLKRQASIQTLLVLVSVRGAYATIRI